MTTARARLDELLAGLTDTEVAPVEITSVTLDSRRAGPGTLFVAVPGGRCDGRDFIAAALEAGAAAVAYEPSPGFHPPRSDRPCIAIEGLRERAGEIASRLHGHPSRRLAVVGVTGTNGKSSCTHFLAHAFTALGQPCAVVGTLGNGLWGDLEETTHTTPDAPTLQALLARFVEAGAERVAMEVSSHALDQGRVAGVTFDTALFTNLSRDHLDYHGDMASYGRAKAALFAIPGLRRAVVNADDPFGRELLETLARRRVPTIAYGLEGVAAPLPEGIEPLAGRVHCHSAGLRLEVEWNGEKAVIESPLLGRFNGANLLGALGVLLGAGVALEQAARALSQVRGVAGRMEPFGGGEAPLVVVDYAHTPDALEQVLLALRAHCQGALWLVFGCGGERDEGKRPLMGAVAARHADHVVVTDDNPRHEDPERIVAQIRAGMAGSEARVIHDRERAIAHAITRARAGDVVLVAGKGHERDQQIGDRRRPFSDRDTVRRLLEEAA